MEDGLSGMMLPMIIVNKWMEHGKNQVIDFVQVHDQSLEAFVQKMKMELQISLLLSVQTQVSIVYIGK